MREKMVSMKTTASLTPVSVTYDPAKAGQKAPAFEIFFVNHGYASSHTPATFSEAVAVARKAGFDALICQGGERLATWSAVSGLRMVG